MFRIGHLARAFRPTMSSFAQPRTLLQQSPMKASILSTQNASLLVQSRLMSSKKHKKIIKLAKGFRGRSNRCFSVAYHRVLKAQQYAYRDRKVKKRDMRKLWILRVNAATRMYGLPYSNLINLMGRSNIKLDRKVLADLAVNEPLSFRSVVEVVKSIFPKTL